MSEDPRDGDRDRPRASGPTPGGSHGDEAGRDRAVPASVATRPGADALDRGRARPPAPRCSGGGRRGVRELHEPGMCVKGSSRVFPPESCPSREAEPQATGGPGHTLARSPLAVSCGGEVPRVPAPRRALLALLPSRLWRFQPFWVAAVERQMEVIKLSGVPGLGTRVSSAGLYRTSGGKRRALGGCWTLPKTPLGPKVKQKGEEHLFILFLRLSLLGGRPPSEHMAPWGGGSNEDLGYLGAGGLCQGVCADAPGMVAGLQQASQEWSLPSVLG